MQRNRFFTLCHYPVSRLSLTVFFPLFKMTMGGKGVIVRETVSVILSECEGSVTRDEEDGKKIKAISCELSATS